MPGSKEGTSKARAAKAAKANRAGQASRFASTAGKSEGRKKRGAAGEISGGGGKKRTGGAPSAASKVPGGGGKKREGGGDDGAVEKCAHNNDNNNKCKGGGSGNGVGSNRRMVGESAYHHNIRLNLRNMTYLATTTRLALWELEDRAEPPSYWWPEWEEEKKRALLVRSSMDADVQDMVSVTRDVLGAADQDMPLGVCFWANKGFFHDDYSPVLQWPWPFSGKAPVRQRFYLDAATNKTFGRNHRGKTNDRCYHDMWYDMWLGRLDALCSCKGTNTVDDLCSHALDIAGAAAKGEPCIGWKWDQRYGWDGNVAGRSSYFRDGKLGNWLYDDVARVCELQQWLYGLGLVHRLLDPGVGKLGVGILDFREPDDDGGGVGHCPVRDALWVRLRAEQEPSNPKPSNPKPGVTCDLHNRYRDDVRWSKRGAERAAVAVALQRMRGAYREALQAARAGWVVQLAADLVDDLVCCVVYGMSLNEAASEREWLVPAKREHALKARARAVEERERQQRAVVAEREEQRRASAAAAAAAEPAAMAAAAARLAAEKEILAAEKVRLQMRARQMSDISELRRLGIVSARDIGRLRLFAGADGCKQQLVCIERAALEAAGRPVGDLGTKGWVARLLALPQYHALAVREEATRRSMAELQEWRARRQLREAAAKKAAELETAEQGAAKLEVAE